MAESGKLALIGGVFLLSIAVLVIGILWLKDVRLGSQNAEVKVEFPSTSGLMKGDPVEVRGVVSGEVAEVAFEEGRALVTVQLDRDIPLYDGTRFLIQNAGLMGQKKITVDPGRGGTPVESETRIFKGEYEPGIPEFMSQIGTMMNSVQDLAHRVDGLLATVAPSDRGSLTNILRNTDRVSADLAALLDESRGDLTVSARNLRAAMEDLHQTLDGREQEVGVIIGNAARASDHLERSLVKFESTMDRLNSALGDEDLKNGSMAQFVRDPHLYEELVAAMKEFRVLVEDMRTNPKRYVSFSLF